MKKIICVLSFLLMVSCAHEDQKIAPSFDLKDQNSTLGHGRGLTILVVDDRSNKEIIGKRFFSKDNAPKIKIEANLTELLQKKLTQNLMGRGFNMGKDKIVKLSINTLSYEAKIGYPVGTSRAEVSLRIMIVDSKNGAKFIKNYGSVQKSKHFMYPLESTVFETVNGLLQDTMQEIISDDAFIETLLK